MKLEFRYRDLSMRFARLMVQLHNVCVYRAKIDKVRLYEAWLHEAWLHKAWFYFFNTSDCKIILYEVRTEIYQQLSSPPEFVARIPVSMNCWMTANPLSSFSSWTNTDVWTEMCSEECGRTSNRTVRINVRKWDSELCVWCFLRRGSGPQSFWEGPEDGRGEPDCYCGEEHIRWSCSLVDKGNDDWKPGGLEEQGLCITEELMKSDEWFIKCIH